MAKKEPRRTPIESVEEHVGGYPTMLYREGEQPVIAADAEAAAVLEADGWGHEPHASLVVEDHSVARTKTP